MFAIDREIGIGEVTVALIVLGIMLLLFQASRKGYTCLDLVTDKGSGKLSLTKVLNLLGGLVGTWVVVRMAMDRTLGWDVFTAYLLYCASTHGFSNYLSAKFRPGEPPADGTMAGARR